jgi:hypothetical protein
MTEVLKVLQELNVYWKKIGHYNMKCRWTRHIPGQNETMLNLNHGPAEEIGIIINDDCCGDNLKNVVKYELQVSCFLFNFPWRRLVFSTNKGPQKKCRCYIVWSILVMLLGLLLLLLLVNWPLQTSGIIA